MPTLGRAHVATLAVGTFTLGVDGFVLSGLLPQVAASLRVSVGAAGQLTTVFALVYALASPVLATVAGRWDRRRLLAMGMVVFAVGVGLQALGNEFAVVEIGRVVSAVGAAAYQATAYSTVGSLSDDAHRARNLAVVVSGSSVALVVGLPLGILLGQVWGWRSAMWVLIALAVLSALAVSTLPSAHLPPLSLRERGRALGDRRVLQILLGTTAVLVPSFIVLAFLPVIVSASAAWVVVFMLGFGAGQVAGTSAVARIIERWDARIAFRTAAVVVTLAAAALTVTRTSVPATLVTMAVLGVGAGLAVVPQQSRLFQVVPRLASVAIGLNGSAIYLASAGGAALGGVAIASGADATTLAAATVGLLGVLVAAFVIPEGRSAASLQEVAR